MRKITFIFISLLCSFSAFAQVGAILGDWATVDDKTGDSYSIVRIYKAADGLYYGKIHKMLVGNDLRCTECPGDDKNSPLEGLVIIRGFQEKNGELVGGKVLDPESGKFYYGKIYLKNGRLVLRGSIDKLGVLGRSQTWRRAKKQ
ncbi:MAG: DUF2147 domain-containing protein [Paludibacteraceae bacterium]|nr:DUF2147 domain-containing protein [Paludibacteraceae bacterium]